MIEIHREINDREGMVMFNESRLKISQLPSEHIDELRVERMKKR